jgi:hypothetical protein
MKVNNKLLLFVFSLSFFSVVSISQAAITGSFVFDEPTGVVLNTDAIDIWVTLTLDEDSDPLVFDKNAELYGFDESALPEYGDCREVPFATYGGVGPNTGVLYNEFYLTGYTYTLESLETTWLGGIDNLSLSAGDSVSILWGILVPNETLESGTLYFDVSTVMMGFLVWGYDAEGITICPTEVCQFYNENTFTRTVSAVPIPGAVWLLGSCLLGATGFRRFWKG